MARRERPWLSNEEKAELWRRWKEGQTLTDIALSLSKRSGSIHHFISAHGGIAPAPRRRSSIALTLLEREEISRGLAVRQSIRAIASVIGRSPSTVSREIAHGGGIHGYRASPADESAWARARRPKVCLLAQRPRLCQIVAAKLALQWSPQQISAWLEREHPNDETMRVSHETIYRSLFLQARGVLKKELIAHLRSRRVMRRSRYATTKGQPRGQIIDAVSIRDRPADVEDRAVPGHWEGDLLSGTHRSHIATLVERRSRFTLLVKVAGKDTASVVGAISKQIRKLPRQLRQSLTWDRGPELAHHKRFTVATDVKVYFCDPQSPWQRGTNENTNRLLRQYFPHGIDLSPFTQQDLNRIAQRLNQRPRKTLGYRTPADMLGQGVASIG